MKINFFKPFIKGNETKYLNQLLKSGDNIGGDGPYTKQVHQLLEKKYQVKKALLTTSGTSALEFAVRLLDLKPGDEIIAPSFTFSSTINAILLNQGLKVVFAEIQADTLNIDPVDIEKKITSKTKAIIVVHYAGVCADMEKIMNLAKKYNLKVIEDAAQGIEAKYNDKFLGTIGDFGCLSFHETKNITCGEGGALFINSDNKQVIERAEIIREKGTNRSKFFRGQIDKYTWVDIGSSYLPSDILAAFLLGQLENSEKITKLRLKIYNYYCQKLSAFAKKNIIKLPKIPKFSHHNAHIFYILFNNGTARDFALKYLKSKGVGATFHYIPLHSSPQGKKLGFKKTDLAITEKVSQTLLRLPLWAGMTEADCKYVVKTLLDCLKKL